MSERPARKKAKRSVTASHVDPHENVEQQRQTLIVNDKNRLILKAKDKLRQYIDSMTEAELTRYEHYRRSSFKPEIIQALMRRTMGTTFIKPIADAEFRRISVIMAGLTKMYIGDIIEESLKVMQGEKKTNSAQGPPGPLHPHHVREAYRKLKAAGKLIHEQPGSMGV